MVLPVRLFRRFMTMQSNIHCYEGSSHHLTLELGFYRTPSCTAMYCVLQNVCIFHSFLWMCCYHVFVPILEIVVLSSVTLVAVSVIFEIISSTKLNSSLFLHSLPLHTLPFIPLSSSPLLSSPCSLRTDEPGHISVGHLDRLRVSQRTAVPDGRHAHPTPVHPEEQRGITADCLPVQPEPWRAALHARCPAARPP